MGVDLTIIFVVCDWVDCHLTRVWMNCVFCVLLTLSMKDNDVRWISVWLGWLSSSWPHVGCTLILDRRTSHFDVTLLFSITLDPKMEGFPFLDPHTEQHDENIHHTHELHAHIPSWTIIRDYIILLYFMKFLTTIDVFLLNYFIKKILQTWIHSNNILFLLKTNFVPSLEITILKIPKILNQFKLQNL